MKIQDSRFKKGIRESRHQSVKVQGGFMSKVQFRLFLVFVFSLITIHFSLFTVSHATDDTGTQGKGKFQLEVSSEFTYDKETEEGVTTKETGGELLTVFTYGAIDNLDIFIEAPYVWSKTKVDGVVDPADPSADAKGFSDIAIDAKWRFYEHEGLSFALKPGITLPTGDEKKGLGTGRMTYNMFFITTKELEPWAFHLNLGYTRNENKVDERKDIWHVSAASEVEVIKDLTAKVDIGMERNPDKTSNTHPAYILGELSYSITENFEVNVGVKGGLNKPETDTTFLAGIAMRF